MESLPDDVIVHIFSFLSARDLLGPVRGVCRSWRTLALHRDAWKHVEITCWQRLDILESALRLAPCLHRLVVSYKCPRSVERAMATTGCQVERLHVASSFEPYACALHLLRRQVPHTKYLTLTLADGAPEILALIQDMALRELDITLGGNVPFEGDLLVDRPFRNSCLKRLFVDSYPDRPNFDPLIESLVRANAASLQEFACLDRFGEMPLTWKALRALDRRLKLTVPASSLTDVIGMENLSHLAVRVFGSKELDAAEKQGLSALSEGLICASSVTFVNGSSMYACRPMSVSLCLQEMGALGRCGHIESLAFFKITFSEGIDSLTVKGLPNLRELRLSRAPLPGPWLDAMEGLKSLQLLDLGSSECDRSTCGVPALRRLVARVPGLHVIKQRLEDCCLESSGRSKIEGLKVCGLRGGHCQPECALCARYRHATGGRWITVSDDSR